MNQYFIDEQGTKCLIVQPTIKEVIEANQHDLSLN